MPLSTISPLAAALMEGFAARVAARMGLHFPPERWPELERGISAWAEASGSADAGACMQRWMDGPASREAIESLATHLSVGETYFFREPASFEALVSKVLPPLITARRAAKHRALRIWSAGCASGEEAYSLAIVLHRLIPDLAGWDIHILGTDIHPGLLAVADEGAYGDWSFRGESASPAASYFECVDHERVRVRSELRRLVHFDFLNLADGSSYPPPQTVDLVLCRHVLMYFEPVQAQRLVARLHAALADDACLVVGAVEGGHRHFAGFDDMRLGGAFYRKQSLGARATSSPVVTLPAGLATLEQAAQQPAHAAQSRLEEILACCRAALAADRCNAELHLLQALVHEELGEYEAAREALRRALFLDPGCVVAHLALGRLCEREGQGARAARHIDNALELLRRRAASPERSAPSAAKSIVAELLAQAREASR